MSCDYCGFMPKDIVSLPDRRVALEIDGGEVVVWEDGEDCWSFRVNFCPICGRDLRGAYGRVTASGARVQFVACGSVATARKIAPWANKLASVEGGYMAFEHGEDWLRWKRAGKPMEGHKDV